MATVLTRAERLGHYLTPHVLSRWRWGSVDCVFLAINWVRDITGIDPAERLRGSYSDEAGAKAVIEREGGFVEMVQREMAAHAFAETTSPDDGDVAIVSAPVFSETEHDLVMAIRSGNRWVVKTARGIRAGQYAIVCAWKIA